jgi:hypothetical protein
MNTQVTVDILELRQQIAQIRDNRLAYGDYGDVDRNRGIYAMHRGITRLLTRLYVKEVLKIERYASVSYGNYFYCPSCEHYAMKIPSSQFYCVNCGVNLRYIKDWEIIVVKEGAI